MDKIIFSGISTNNLKNIDIAIPQNTFSTITGVSGSGKSSLVFDTIFAEGHRRYIDTLSTYMRQFIEKVEPPDVKEVKNILPTIALKQHNPNHNSRSTVGTVTEISSFLRELYSNVSELKCTCGMDVKIYSLTEISDFIKSEKCGKLIYVIASLEIEEEYDISGILKAYLQYGFIRVVGIDNSLILIESLLESGSFASCIHNNCIKILVDRLKSTTDDDRIIESLQLSRKFFSNSTCLLNPENSREFNFYFKHICPGCGRNYPEPTNHLFSFNFPLGACSTCQGFGSVGIYPEDKLVPDTGLSLEEGAISLISKPSFSMYFNHVLESCKVYGIPIDIPYCELSLEHKKMINEGKNDFEGLDHFIKCLERKRYKKHISILLSRIREYVTCPTCDGERLNDNARRYFIRNKNITDLEKMEISDLKLFIDDLVLKTWINEKCGLLIEKIMERLDYLIKVGLPYLSLNRRSRTLSGGEFQRIRLASLLGTSLYNTLYILDEPTIGLHGSDSQKLIEILKKLRDRDNTIIVVEHDSDFILNSDFLIELGPGGGDDGGTVIFQGTIDQFHKQDSITKYELEVAREGFVSKEKIKSSSMKYALELNKIKYRNLNSLNLIFPHNTMIAITGVSGSGKSTLLNEIINCINETGKNSLIETNKVAQINGNQNFNSIVMIDQNPIGRSTRSIPATYLKIFTEIRKLFAGTNQAKYLGFTKGDFSFNSGSGRCPECNGSGYSCVDLLFLPDLMLPCHVCNGKRFSKELLEVVYNGKNIHEVLKMTISEARDFFEYNKLIKKSLDFPIQIGIGYLQLGQVSSTLSGGESQRLKLSKFLFDECGSNLILLDEPTTGLHLKDISLLLDSLNSLKDSGATIITVEHNPYFISQCDWVIDLGPSGGAKGGTLMYQGDMNSFITTCDSMTAVYLRKFLK